VDKQMGEPVHGEMGEVTDSGEGVGGVEVRLEIHAVFELETGFLIVGKGPRLGEDSLGARGFCGDGYAVRPKRVVNKGAGGSGDPPSLLQNRTPPYPSVGTDSVPKGLQFPLNPK
jgi:hypothetical protein